MALYTPGQVARMLGVSSHRIRRLCESGVLDAELTDGNRWQIPDSEAERLRERLKQEGDLPPVPRMEPSAGAKRRPNPDYENGEDRDGAEAEPTVSPEVQAEADSLAIAERRLKRRRVELDTEQVEDAFRERESRMLAEEEEQARAQVNEQKLRDRRKWEESWRRWGGTLIPSDAPADCRLAADKEIQLTLADLCPEQSEELVRDLVRAAVLKRLAPYERQQKARDAMKQAVDSAVLSLPAQLGDDCRAKARQAATDAVVQTSRKVGEFATAQDFVAAAKAAVQPVTAAGQRQVRERELENLKRLVIDGYWSGFLEATQEDREDGVRAIREAFDDVCDPLTTRDELEKIRDTALAPIRARITGRQGKKAAVAQAEWTADGKLYHVASYLRDSFSDCFDNVTDRWQTEREFKDELRPLILKRLLSGKLAPADVEGFIESWIDEEMEEDSEDDFNEEEDEE